MLTCLPSCTCLLQGVTPCTARSSKRLSRPTAQFQRQHQLMAHCSCFSTP